MNHKNIKRWLCLMLAFLLSFSFLLTSCGAKESDEELLAIAKDLCERSDAVNQLYFGKGIAPKEGGYVSGTYTQADEVSLAAYGVGNMEDIKNMARAVYSTAVYIWMENTVLESDKKDGEVLTYSRYYYDTDKDCMMVRTAHDPLVKGEVVYSDYKMVKAEKDLVTFTVTMTVTYEGKSKVYEDTKLTMCNENGVWKLDTPSYATY